MIQRVRGLMLLILQ